VVGQATMLAHWAQNVGEPLPALPSRLRLLPESVTTSSIRSSLSSSDFLHNCTPTQTHSSMSPRQQQCSRPIT